MRVHQHGATATRWSGNAATVSAGLGGEQSEDPQSEEAQVGDSGSDTGGSAGIL